jgi:DNA-binding protein HU-beta
MNKMELVKTVAERTGKTQKDIKTVMETVQEVTFEALHAGEEVKLIDGLTLYTVEKEARTARNPRTGETVTVPSKIVPMVKKGKALKEAVA